MHGFFHDFDSVFEQFTGGHQRKAEKHHHSNEQNHQQHYHHINVEGKFKKLNEELSFI